MYVFTYHDRTGPGTSDFRRCPKCLFHDCRRSFAVFDICRYVYKCHYYQMPLYQMPLYRQLPLFLLPLRLMPFDTFARVTFATLYTIATKRNAMICLLPLWDKCRSRDKCPSGSKATGSRKFLFLWRENIGFTYYKESTNVKLIGWKCWKSWSTRKLTLEPWLLRKTIVELGFSILSENKVWSRPKTLAKSH